MIAINSNCSRVDAVKAAATLLKLQSTIAGSSATGSSAQGSDAARKVNSDLQALDGVIKTGDAQKAELALAATRKDVEAAETAPRQKSGTQDYQSLDAYA
jgi:hypothetical protein